GLAQFRGEASRLSKLERIRPSRHKRRPCHVFHHHAHHARPIRLLEGSPRHKASSRAWFQHAVQLAQSFSAISEEHYSETAGGQIEAPAGKRQIMRICLTRGKVCEPTLTSALVGEFEKLSAELKSRDVTLRPDPRC